MAIPLVLLYFSFPHQTLHAISSGVYLVLEVFHRLIGVLLGEDDESLTDSASISFFFGFFGLEAALLPLLWHVDEPRQATGEAT